MELIKKRQLFFVLLSEDDLIVVFSRSATGGRFRRLLVYQAPVTSVRQKHRKLPWIWEMLNLVLIETLSLIWKMISYVNNLIN